MAVEKKYCGVDDPKFGEKNCSATTVKTWDCGIADYSVVYAKDLGEKIDAKKVELHTATAPYYVEFDVPQA